jgi:hypothetical protein
MGSDQRHLAAGLELGSVLGLRGRGQIRIQADRGNEYCGKQETHDYPLSLALNDIEHTTAPKFPKAIRYKYFCQRRRDCEYCS